MPHLNGWELLPRSKKRDDNARLNPELYIYLARQTETEALVTAPAAEILCIVGCFQHLAVTGRYGTESVLSCDQDICKH